MKVYMTEECRQLMMNVLGILPEAQVTRQDWEVLYCRLDRIVLSQDNNLPADVVQALSKVLAELEHIIGSMCIQELTNYTNDYLRSHRVSF